VKYYGNVWVELILALEEDVAMDFFLSDGEEALPIIGCERDLEMATKKRQRC